MLFNLYCKTCKSSKLWHSRTLGCMSILTMQIMKILHLCSVNNILKVLVVMKCYHAVKTLHSKDSAKAPCDCTNYDEHCTLQCVLRKITLKWTYNYKIWKCVIVFTLLFVCLHPQLLLALLRHLLKHWTLTNKNSNKYKQPSQQACLNGYSQYSGKFLLRTCLQRNRSM